MPTTADVVAQAKAMVAQTQAQGSTPFAGSSFDASAPNANAPAGSPARNAYDKLPNTGIALNGQQPSDSPQYGTGGGGGATSSTGQYTPPAVMTSGNVTKTVIPDLNTRLSKLTQTGQYTDANGVSRYSDGSIVPQDAGNTASTPSTTTTPEDDSISQLLESMKSNLDSTTKAQIDDIHSQYEQKRAAQAKVNDFANKGREASLLMGGSARYAQDSSTGIQTAQFQYGLDEINSLNREEQVAVNAAKAAQQKGNFDIMSKQLDIAEKKREEKQAAAQKIADKQAEELKVIKEKNIQSSRDDAVSNLVSQGITDPKQLLDYLNYDQAGNKVGDFSLKEINDALGNVIPKGLDDLIKTARGNNAPVDIMSKAVKATSLDEAYKILGNYAAGGTGIVGEYNFYKANGGNLSFDDYQTRDANRKAAASSVGSGASQALLSAIAMGMIDPSRLNSRTIGIYNQIAGAGIDAIGAHAGAAGETKAVQDLTTYKSTATRTLGTVERNLPLVVSLADKVNKSGIPGLDRIIAGGATYTGNNPDVIQYVNSLKTLRSEYAQMLSKGAVATDSDKRDAAEAIPSGLSSAGYTALGIQLSKEAKNIIASSDDAIAAAKSKNPVSAQLNSEKQSEDEARKKVFDAGGLGDQHPELRQHISQMKSDGLSGTDILNWVNQQI